MSADVNPEREALRVLAERGWCKGRLESSDGRRCLVGAAAAGVVGHQIDWMEVLGNIRAVAQEQFPERRAVGVVDFNDHPDTTLEDVIAVLEKAAIRRSEAVT